MTELSDDLETQWAAADGATRRGWIEGWRLLGLTWRQRRRIRNLVGEPLTVSTGAEHNLRYLNRDNEHRQWRQRIVREHGSDGLNSILELADRLMMKRPGIPDERAYHWAEQKFKEGLQ